MSIVDLSLLETLRVSDAGDARVGLIPTFSGCPALAVFGSVDWASMVPTAASHRTERHADFAALLSRMLEAWELDRSARW